VRGSPRDPPRGGAVRPRAGRLHGAIAQRRGRVEQAHGGTLFLDEVGEIPLALQIKLLRLLEDREFERVGGEETLRSDFRLVAATNADLRRAVAERRFREDLYYRLKVVEMEVPPLRVRAEDIALLAAHFARLHAASCGKPVRDISPEAIEALQPYSWPGNVRELDHAIERAVVLTRNPRIELGDLPPAVLEGGTSPVTEGGGDLLFPLVGRRLREVEDLLIERTVAHCGGSVKDAARVLGISERTIFRHRRERAASHDLPSGS
jgi:two-component system response regulator HydG